MNNFRFVDSIVKEEIVNFSNQFYMDYCSEKGKKKKNIINKENNIFISALGKNVILYSALMRSLDSSLGNRLQVIAKRIASRNYIVKEAIEGRIPKSSVDAIANLLNEYENHKIPKDDDINSIYSLAGTKEEIKAHKSDYYLTLKSDHTKKFLVELKAGGDLDNKKAMSEKEALLKQYVNLRNSNEIGSHDEVKILLCMAYNKNGEGKEWVQERVGQFFSPNEIKVGKDFWDFICNQGDGYGAVKSAYMKYSHYLKDTVEKIVAYYSS